ncbi:MAG: putative redox protein, regulator of disulfide bond formation [Halomonas sp. HL-48]|nr:sulfurtransferase TusA family protein [Halomonas sp. HL-48]KPQ26344.1 MAG: putative redox protein, regulator of disulfide bond formation [Halomonas sp. HL-48]
MIEQTTRLQPDTVLDACGLHCPLPLLKAKQALAGLAAGQLLEVRATDAGSWRDIEAFAEQSAHRLEAREQRGDIYHYWLRKAEGERS